MSVLVYLIILHLIPVLPHVRIVSVCVISLSLTLKIHHCPSAFSIYISHIYK